MSAAVVVLNTQPILLATNGLKEADGAIVAAALLSQTTGRPVRIVAVLEPPPIVAGEYGFIAPVANVWEDRRDTLLLRVRRQLDEVVGRHIKWPIHVRSGNPPSAIAADAKANDAAIVIMGLGQHHLVDRLVGTETALHTLREISVPVFAVPESFATLPKRAVVAVDFSDAGLAAARRALELLPSLTSLLLVHVAPRWDLEPAAYIEWRSEYERGIGPAFERVSRELAAPAGVAVTTSLREGKPVRQLLEAVDEATANVIVMGSRGLGFFDRMLVGSTATGIIRGTQSAVFALPVAAIASKAETPDASGALAMPVSA